MDLFNWIGSPIRIPPNVSFVFVADLIRAHLPGASFGTRLNGAKHGLVIVLVVAWVSKDSEISFNKFRNQNQKSDI